MLITTKINLVNAPTQTYFPIFGIHPKQTRFLLFLEAVIYSCCCYKIFISCFWKVGMISCARHTTLKKLFYNLNVNTEKVPSLMHTFPTSDGRGTNRMTSIVILRQTSKGGAGSSGNLIRNAHSKTYVPILKVWEALSCGQFVLWNFHSATMPWYFLVQRMRQELSDLFLTLIRKAILYSLLLWGLTLFLLKYDWNMKWGPHTFFSRISLFPLHSLVSISRLWTPLVTGNFTLLLC